MNDTKAVILAAGLGTRLQPLTYAIPKEMVPVCGKPLVQHAVELIRSSGIRNIVVIVGGKKGALMDFLKDGRWLDVDISYRFQEERTGNATALHTAKPLIDKTFVAMFGDEIIEPKESVIKDMLEKHRARSALCTIGISAVNEPKRYGIVKFSEDGTVLDIVEKPQDAGQLDRLAVGGVHYASNGLFVFEPEIFDYIKKLQPGRGGEHWLADAIRDIVSSGEKCVAHVHKGIYRDVGTFEALLAVERELLNSMK